MGDNNQNTHILTRIDKMEKDLSQLVTLMSEETANRRVFEERMTNAIVAMSDFQKTVTDVANKQHRLELFLATEVSTVADRTKLHERIDVVENSQKQNTWVIDGGKSIAWLLFCTAVAFISYSMRGG